MRKEFKEIDTGMIHYAVIPQNGRRIIISKDPFKSIKVGENSADYGRVAIEEGKIVNEDGIEFGEALTKFQKKLWTKVEIV